MPEQLPEEHLNLPATTLGGEVEADVVDGEIVDEPGPQRPVYVLQVVKVVQVINIVVQHESTRAVARHGSLVAVGAVVMARRWHRHRTFHRRMAEAAAAAGEHEIALRHRQHAEIERHQRHERVVAAGELAVLLAKAAPAFIGGAFAVMVVLGFLLAMAQRRVEAVAIPFEAAAQFAQDAVSVGPDIALALAIALPTAGVAALYHAGGHAGDLAPGWAIAAKPGDDEGGLVVTADTIVLALQNLDKVPALKRAFATGWRPTFTLQPVRDGRGYESEFSVPLGVTPEMIADQRAVLARNLHRDEIETWPSAGAPGYTRLWVADRGAIGKAAPEYPLLHEGGADVFEGVPGGVLARGDGALIPINEATIVLGGLPGQGKSNAARVIMLGCATDPLCGLDVFVFANNGDFDVYEPRLAVYRKGLDDDVIEAAMERLHESYQDVGERERMLADLGAKKVTRQLARQYPELRPHISLFSECHELFGHPEYGAMAGELAVKIVKRQRKTARSAVFDTQSSRAKAIPGALVELASVNVCFAVKGWRNNDGFLGDGSFQAGIRATELRPTRDRGTALVTGISDEQFELLKWYLIDVDDDIGRDDARPVIARCMKTVDPRTPVAGNSPRPAIEVRDLLTDLANIIGAERAKLRDLAGMLRTLAPTWGRYRSLTAKQLGEDLADEGVRVVNSSGTPYLDPADLRRAIAERGE